MFLMCLPGTFRIKRSPSTPEAQKKSADQAALWNDLSATPPSRGSAQEEINKLPKVNVNQSRAKKPLKVF